jgi:2-iminobutanoate/2-iminopropanoate deaminase
MPLNNLDKTAISTNDAPAAIGPYSQAIRVGTTLFTSGQVALDPATGALVAGGIEAQTTRVCENLKAVLAAAGVDFTHVVKTTVFLKSMADFAAMNDDLRNVLRTPRSRPTRALHRAGRRSAQGRARRDRVHRHGRVADKSTGGENSRRLHFIAQQCKLEQFRTRCVRPPG